MTRIPEVLGRLQGIEVLNFGNNLQLPPEEINRLLPMLADSPAAATLQILYLNANNMTVLDGEAVSRIPKIGLLDLSSNKNAGQATVTITDNAGGNFSFADTTSHFTTLHLSSPCIF